MLRSRNNDRTETALGILRWAGENKDALVGMAAIASPLISAFVAYLAVRATKLGPATQKEIARDQLKLTSQQLEFQKRQAAANILGAQKQKSAEQLRDTIADWLDIVDRHHFLVAMIAIRNNSEQDPLKEKARLEVMNRDYSKASELYDKARLTLSKLELLFDNPDNDDLHFLIEARKLLSFGKLSGEEFSRLRAELVVAARPIIHKRLVEAAELLELHNGTDPERRPT